MLIPPRGRPAVARCRAALAASLVATLAGAALGTLAGAALGTLARSALAAPAHSGAAPRSTADPAHEGDVVLGDFAFRSGERLPELRLHYLALGRPRRDGRGEVTNAVLILHGTGGSGRQFLSPQFAGELYGAGAPLDTTRYWVLLPDGIGD